MRNSPNNDVTQVIILDDDQTPYGFVIDLLREVFSMSDAEARLIAAACSANGEAECGLWPGRVAETLVEAAGERVVAAGHPLAFVLRDGAGRRVPEQRLCSFCGKPASHVKTLFDAKQAAICDECVLRSAGALSGRMSGAAFNYAYQLLDWHFAGIGREGLESLSRKFPSRMRADLQRAIDRLLSPNAVHQIGVRQSYAHEQMSIADLWVKGQGAKLVTPVRHTELDVGDDRPVRCVDAALWLLETYGTRHAVLLTQLDRYSGSASTVLEIIVPAGEEGARLVERYFREIEGTIRAAATYRGKTLSLDAGPQWVGLATGVTVHKLPRVAREDIILPDETLALLDRNIMGFAARRNELRAVGQPTKKGLLFYGPPGTGKTHTLMYLSGCLPDHTTLLVTAEEVRLLGEYFSLARLMQPAILVIEDVDLIARDREQIDSPGVESILNKLLNEMDGLRDDAEIFCILTTNRPEHIEAALAGRPGRVDQAVEFSLPDEAGRRKLLALYGRGLRLRNGVVDEAVRRTEGVSAAFIKELMRRSAQSVFERGGDPTVSSTDLDAALTEMLFTGGRLNAVLLGGSEAST